MRSARPTVRPRLAIGWKQAILTLAVASLAVVGAGCGTSGKSSSSSSAGGAYPARVVSQFKTSCVAEAKTVSQASAGAIDTYCGCAIAYIEAHLSFSEFLATEQAEIKLQQAPADGRKAYAAAIKTCAPKTG